MDEQGLQPWIESLSQCRLSCRSEPSSEFGKNEKRISSHSVIFVTWVERDGEGLVARSWKIVVDIITPYRNSVISCFRFKPRRRIAPSS